MNKWIQSSITNQVATVTLNRPEVHNAFNDEMILTLQEVFESLSQDDTVRVIILDAVGKSFCAGADLNWMKQMVDYSFEENQADAKRLSDMLFTIRNCLKPVIAKVHGAAFGGGVGLIAACDIAIALGSAKFCLSEVKLGLVPAVISPFVLEKIGSYTRRYALTAERFDATEAHRIGLISTVVDTLEELNIRIDTTVALLLQNGPDAISACKDLLFRVNAETDHHQITQLTTTCIAERRIATEGQEGMRAFLEKRPPAWHPQNEASHAP